VISNNRIQSLPHSIGRLENLKILLTDVNALTWLPSSIGHCKSMRILNAASNNLLSLPEEIGQLKEMRVLNLANNYLRHLPCTIADLPNLTALWLNDNQKKPLIVLELERDEKSQGQVLTCFFFPQTGPIFGPVSPAAAAALLAQQQQLQQQLQLQANNGGQQAPKPATQPLQLVTLGVHKQQQQQQYQQQREMVAVDQYASGRPSQLTTRSGSHLVDEDEDEEGSRLDLLETSNTLDKSQLFNALGGQQQQQVQQARPPLIKQQAAFVDGPAALSGTEWK